MVLRTGWMFKTESVIMPAFLDAVAGPGAGALRGCMPVLSRIGQSVPPLFLADRLRKISHKKLALAALAILMSVPFAALSMLWLVTPGARSVLWMPGVFLGLYLLFFVSYGLYLLSFGTLQGKLIRPTRRGLLLLVSTFCGTIPAIGLTLYLLPGWLGNSHDRPESGTPAYGQIFAFVAMCFFLAGLLALLVFEPGDKAAGRPAVKRGSVANALRALGQDRNLRRLVLVAMLCGSGLMISPHYQALGLGELGLDRGEMMIWVITQSISVGILSLVVGPLADARGYRLTLQGLIFASAVAPAFAAFLPHLDGPLAGRLFWLVYIPLGVSPLVLRTLVNYTLELCPPDSHPRYLSILSLCLAVPFMFSPAVGWLIDPLGPLGSSGFEVVFLGGVCLILLSGLLAFRLDEPRHRLAGDFAQPLGVEGDH